MKKLVFLFLSLLAAGGIFQACDDSKTYAEMLEDEKNAVNKFIKDKGIRIISQDEFEKNDTVTNLDRNEYVAVADYRPVTVASDKIKKKDGDLSIPVERTADILGTIGPKKTHQFLCGFSMETRDMVENSTAKLTRKNLDMVVANNLKVAGAGFGVDTNVVTFITPDGTRELPLMSKADVADAILDEILKRRGL